MADPVRDEAAVPRIVERSTFQAEVDALRPREKAHTREGDAIAAARRRLSMVKVDSATALTGAYGAATLLDAFEGRRMLIAYYFMWYAGRPAPRQCEGCTFFTAQVRQLSNLHARDVTYATFSQGPYEESVRYSGFMGWEIPWYSVSPESLDTLLAGRRMGMMYLICYLRQGSDVFETYWTTLRAALRRWTTTTVCSTSPSMGGRRSRKSRRPAGPSEGRDRKCERMADPPRSGHA